MERKDVLAGGGAEGRSSFLRFPRWFIVGAATYPQNAESRCRDRKSQVVQAEGQCKQTAKGKERVKLLQTFTEHEESSAGRTKHMTTSKHTDSTAAQITVRTQNTSDNNHNLC